MCLWTRQIEPLVAKESIIAYKILLLKDDDYLSPVMYYNYSEFIKEHKIVRDIIPSVNFTNIFGEVTDLGKIHKGLHLYLNKDYAEYVLKQYKQNYFDKFILFKCEIPKGSYYFIGKAKLDICTNQFEFIEEVDKETRDIFEDIEADYWINEQNNNGWD